MKIRWLVGGLSFPGIGVANPGKTVSIGKVVAEELIGRGLAEEVGKKVKKQKIVEEGDK
jgi:hypothetical protein